MKTEHELAVLEVDRTAKLRLLKTTDLDAIIAAAKDGTVDVEELKNGGDVVLEITPNGRGKEIQRVACDTAEEGRAIMRGIELCAGLKKRTAGANGASSPWARKSKAELIAECKKRKVPAANLAAAKTKGDLIALLPVAAKK